MDAGVRSGRIASGRGADGLATEAVSGLSALPAGGAAALLPEKNRMLPLANWLLKRWFKPAPVKSPEISTNPAVFRLRSGP
jgi:hypothetical protein